ncbi:MAG: hypothetical protein EON93_19260 [Burkholderiales bacterium]|nr:MAG: hypothetical protein EON93_19260 [Burkholderiales bacterium]
MSNAIHQRKSDFPNLVRTNAEGKDVLSFQLFKYARKHHRKSTIYLPNFSTAKILGNASGGGPNLATLISTYASERKKFRAEPGAHPVIVVVDNDDGSKQVFSVLNNLLKSKPSRDDPFVHAFGNLYVVPVPRLGREQASIEDLFSAEDKARTIDNRSFDFSKDADQLLTNGKASLAFDYVAKHPTEIDWSGFSPLLQALTDAISHFSRRPSAGPT